MNFTVAERCHYHHATRAHQQQSRPHVSLQHAYGRVEAVRKQAALKKELLRGNDQHENL